jgi:crotonobetainyl-CoA:carnitine CoA-transferase CaiB-like acyl-CoA transferase
MPGPLDGVKVVEIGVWVAGPAAGGILADWGAEVVKIEPPAGDPARTFRRMLGGDMPSNPVFELDNRSKRSITLDLSQPAALEVALELIDGADVFLTNIRGSALARLGLDHESLRARNPGLVYCLLSGYGIEGPDADRPAYDIAAFWARSGLVGLLTPPGGALPFQRGGMGDHTTGQGAAGAICAALLARARTGEGQLVSYSLLRQGAYVVGFDLNMALMWGTSTQVGTREAMGNPCINNYTAGDGRRFWIVGLEGERHWPPLARAVGHPEWLTDERFGTPMGRAQNARELIAALDAIFATKTLDEWSEVFATEPDFFWAPVNSVDELLADEQFLAGGGLVEVPDGSTGTTMLSTPADFLGTPWAPRSLAPKLGEHTRAVLTELGRDEEAIAALLASGAARDVVDDV